MNIRDLEYVVAVAEEKHFGRAAIKCHISQPALSGQILKLEDYLGVTLFERSNRAVQITEIGEQIVEQARKLIGISDDIVASAHAARDPFSGQFRLGLISTIGPYLSPLILPVIKKELPEMSVTLIEGFTTDLESRLLNGELDAAIIATLPGDAHLREVNLYDEPFRIALPPDHSLAVQKTVGTGDLAHDELLLLADGHCLRDQVLDVCHARTGFNNINTRETSLETLLALVAAGDGVTLVPELAMPHNNREIVMRHEKTGTTHRTVRLAYRVSSPRSQLLTRLASLIRMSVADSNVKVID